MLITIKEYAKKVGRAEVTVRERIKKGDINGKKIGRDWLIEENEIYPRDKRIKSGKYRK